MMRFVKGIVCKNKVTGLFTSGCTEKIVENIAAERQKYPKIQEYRVNAMQDILFSNLAIHALKTDKMEYRNISTTWMV